MGVGFEVGVGEVGDFSGVAVELDQIGAVDFAEVGPAQRSIDKSRLKVDNER